MNRITSIRSRGRTKARSSPEPAARSRHVPVGDWSTASVPVGYLSRRAARRAGAPRPASASASCQMPSLWPISRTVRDIVGQGLQARQQAVLRRRGRGRPPAIVGGAGVPSRLISGASVWRARMAVEHRIRSGRGPCWATMVGHGLGRPLAAAIQGTFMVAQPRRAPG